MGSPIDRHDGMVKRATIMIGDHPIEPSLNEIRGRRVEPRTMDVLVHLVDRAPAIVSADELLSIVWKGLSANDNVVHRAISKLRLALGDDAHRPCVLETVPRRGYRLVCPIVRNPAPTPPEPAAGTDPGPPHGMATYHSIAVVPVDVSGGGSSANVIGATFGEGIAEILSATSWEIVGPEASFAIMRRTRDPRSLGTALGVAFVIAARITISNGEIDIRPRLVECTGGRQLWSGHWRGSRDEFLSWQSALVVALAQAVLGKAARVELARQPIARDDWNPWSLVYQAGELGSQKDRLPLLARALELDPKFAPAHAMLATYYAHPRGGLTSPEQRAHMHARGRRHFETALALANDDYDVLRECAMAARYLGERELQLTIARRAFAISPLAADVLGVALVYAGDEQTGIQFLERAAEEPWKLWGGGSPFWMSGAQPLVRLAHIYCRVGRFADSLQASDRLLAVRPQDKLTLLLKLNVLGHLGRDQDARRILPLVQDAYAGWRFANFVAHYREMAGRPDGADWPPWLHNYTGGLRKYIVDQPGGQHDAGPQPAADM